MKIESGKTYITRDGHKVRIICTDRNDSDYPVIGLIYVNNREEVVVFTREGEPLLSNEKHEYDLVEEYNIWHDVEVDTPVLVKLDVTGEWVKRHFAKYEDGKVYTWNHGRTSWTTGNEDDICSWEYAKLSEGNCND